MVEIVKTGIVYIYSTFNNTIAQLTDLAGNTIVRVSGGQITKHDRLKANPTIKDSLIGDESNLSGYLDDKPLVALNAPPYGSRISSPII